MPGKFASKKRALGVCDICGQQYPLKKLKEVIVKQKKTNLLACPPCWDEDHPQLMLGMYPVYDAQAIENPRPDNKLVASRNISWGWNPVGFSDPYNLYPTTDTLLGVTSIGTVTVTTS